MYISFFSKKEGNNLGRVCVMSFFLLSGRIFLQLTGRFCCIKEFVVFFSVVFIFGFVFSSPLDLVFSSICLLSAALCRLSSWAFVWCLLSVYLRIVSCLSEPRLLEVSRAVRLHWRVRGFKLRALADRGNIMFCAKKKVTHVWIHLQARKSILGNSFYLKFELSLAMRGKAVMSTEKRWAL